MATRAKELSDLGNLKLDVTANGIDVVGVGSNFKSESYNILNLQTDTDDSGSSDDGIFKITNGAAGTTKAEFRWDESEDLVHVSYGDHGRHISINSSGNVGIGTGSTAPSATLDVNDASATDNAWNTLAKFRPDLSDNHAEAGIHIQSYPSTTVVADRRAGIQSIGDAGNATSLILNKDGGYVGIGIVDPTHGLTVSDIAGGGTDAAMRRITIKSETHGVNSGFRFDSESADGTARGGGYYFVPGDTDDTTYLGLSATDSDYQMVITREGNVGIGTSDPDYKLDVSGTANVSNTLTAGALTIPSQGMIFNQAFGTGVPSITMTGTANNGRGGAINFKESDGSGGAIANTAAIYSTDGVDGNSNYGGITIAAYQSDIRFSTGTLAGTKMIVASGGNVGINTTDPKSKLDIQGAIAISNGDQDLGTHTYSSYASLVNSGCIKFTAGYSGTLVAGRTFVFKYNAVSWKAYHGTITIASTQGFSKHQFGGYWNNSGGHDVDSFNGANATCAISHTGQTVIVTLTLTAGCTHPMISVEYHQSGGDGPPRLDRAEMTIG